MRKSLLTKCLELAGMGCLTAAGFIAHVGFRLVALGISLLTVSIGISRTPNAPEVER